MAAILMIWEMKTAADVPTFSHSSGLTPSCSNCPGTNPGFRLLCEAGRPDEADGLLHGRRRVLEHYQLRVQPYIFRGPVRVGHDAGPGELRRGRRQGVGGMLATANPDNPFRDWTIVYVPYCTGDLGAGNRILCTVIL